MSERESKTWRERDQARNQSAHRKEAPQHSKLERSASYRSYKTQLNRLFDGSGAIPDALKQKFSDAGIGDEQAARNDAVQEILAAQSPSELLSAYTGYMSSHGVPDHEEALHRALELDQETEILVQALQALARKQAAGELKREVALKQRLKSLLMLCDDDDVHDAAEDIRFG